MIVNLLANVYSNRMMFYSLCVYCIKFPMVIRCQAEIYGKILILYFSNLESAFRN